MSIDSQKTARSRETTKRSGRSSLLVIRDQIFESYALPEEGEVTIGRDPSCDIVINEVSLSRTHARIRLGRVMLVEDLGSSNGSVLRQERLAPNVLTVLSVNETLELGTITVIVQFVPASVRAHRLLDHDQFELGLMDACKTSQAEFSVWHIAAETPLSPHMVTEEFSKFSGPDDLIAMYGPKALEIVLTGTRDRETLAKEFLKTLGTHGHRCHFGSATFPGDGRDPQRLIQHALKKARAGIKDADAAAPEDGQPIIESRAMQHLWQLASRVAQGDISVLILGETGVGKEVLAEHVHRSSKRSGGPFMRLNCGALSPTLLESELFGYEKGAFTGADKAKPGLLEAANGGTLFLDELGEAPKEVQVRLLRVLEESKVLRLGGLKPRDIDVRVLGATNCDLEEEIREGRFRQDLYYRIAGVSLAIPALRDRPEDIIPLALAMIRAAAARMSQAPPTLTEPARKLLLEYSWPGNIRELRNIVERAVLLNLGDEIGPGELPVQKMQSTFAIAPQQAPSTEQPLTEEHAQLIAVLKDAGGNQTQAAKILGIDRKTLVKRMTKYNMARPRKG